MPVDWDTVADLRWDLTPGDCRVVLTSLADASVDAVVTDPPYELGFMGKAWDRTGIAYDVDLWRAVLRVCKPGAHLLAFGGTRTYHRMGCAIEDAGFEIRDSLHWFYGTGFPKSKQLGEGRGTALKPGHEPILLARKPVEGTVTENVQAHGTGGLNVDVCRLVFVNGEESPAAARRATAGRTGAVPLSSRILGVTTAVEANQMGRIGRRGSAEAYTADHPGETEGRWPANVLLDEDAAAELDDQTGELSSGARSTTVKRGVDTGGQSCYSSFNDQGTQAYPADVPASTGGASRFFYCAKASRAERDYGCELLPLVTGGELTGGRAEGSAGLANPRAGAGRTSGGRNTHPTVKPLALMRWLIRLITPPEGLVLDPFVGSGSTGVAAMHEGVAFHGIDLDDSAIVIATARMQRAYEDLYGTAS